MQFSVDDTIAAIASARGGAWRGILRVSGPRTAGCVERCWAAGGGQRLEDLNRPTVVPGLWRIGDRSPPLAGELYWWPDRRSFARQPTAEFHTLGCPPLLDAALAAACAAGARLARPGEFTLRAFLAGRIDLTQAEAVLGVIDAAGPAQLDAALSQLAGGLSRSLFEIRDHLVDLLAHVEASLDFVSEDIQLISRDELEAGLRTGRRLMDRLVERMAARNQSDAEPRVVLTGRPNSGKSSLFNALCGQAAAIVADVPGTTRDYVEQRLVLAGQTCVLIDTAGIDSCGGEKPLGRRGAVEFESQAVASQQRRQAAVELFCLDASGPLGAWERAQLAVDPPLGVTRIIVPTKSDLTIEDGLSVPGSLSTSSRTGQGVERLRAAIAEALAQRAAAAEGLVAATVVRCRESLRRAVDSLARALELVSTDQEELVAAELRLALEDLGEVAGTVYTDDLLDRVFSRFCIGK